MSIIDTWTTSTIERTRDTFKLKQLYELQAEFLFNQYEPVRASPSEAAMPFLQRLDRWLGCFDSPEDQWNVFRSLKYFFFIGREETDELYRCAVSHKLLPWLIERDGLDIFSCDFQENLDKAIHTTWPCPVTDSLRINNLLHRTNLKGQSLRPDWLSLKQLGDKEKIAKYKKDKKVKYLALFEDFVGSGMQCERATKFALDAFDGPIILAPLVVCHPGDVKLHALAAASKGRLTYEPIVVLASDCLITEIPDAGEPKSFATFRIALQNGHRKGAFADPAFGWEGVGSLVSSYSNCPNNSPPIFHGMTESWLHPLFPRKGRV